MAARQFLLISDSASPMVSGEASHAVMGLARALVGAGASATVLSLASPEAAAAVPGLARRLRTVKVHVPAGLPDRNGMSDGASTREVPLYEGKAPLSQAHLMVAGAQGRDRGESAILLAEAARSLGDDGLLKADVTIAWGETAALALSVVPAAARLFVLPSGRVGGLLSDAETAAVALAGIHEAGVAGPSLSAIGAAFANAIVTPSASAARLVEDDRGIADRASDESLVPIRFACDDPPHDPATDTALPANYSAKSLTGKLECRRVLTRRHSLALGPRTLVLGTAPLRHGKGGDEIVAALGAFAKLDVATLIPGEGDADLLERARRLAIQSPGRLAVLEDGDAQQRVLRAAADAMLFADRDDRTARATGLAQRYGALPIAFDSGASRDYLADYDSASATGSAILYGSLDIYEIEAAVRRAVALRAVADEFAPLIQRAMETAPRWILTAAAIEELCAAFV